MVRSSRHRTAFSNWPVPVGTTLPPDLTTGSRFQIYRPPVRSAASSLELPIGAYIDLNVSGFDDTGALGMLSNNGGQPIILMFNPEGSMTEFYNNSPPLPINTDLFFLIANGKQAGPVNSGGTEVPMDFTDSTTLDASLANAADLPNLDRTSGSLWAVVSHRNATVRTIDNLGPHPNDTQTTGINDQITYLEALISARQVARAGPDTGGR